VRRATNFGFARTVGVVAWFFDGHTVLVVVFAVVAFDALVPFLPSGTMVSLAGVVAASGRLSLVLIVAVASVAAFTGDNLVSAVAVGGRARRRPLVWRRTAYRIILGRCLPTARLVDPRSRFQVLEAVAAALWAGTAAMCGYFGGTAFAGRPVPAAVVALAAGAVVMGLVEIAGRRLLAGRPLVDRRPAAQPPVSRRFAGLAGVVPGTARNRASVS
jgi:membrane-associated protein